MGKDPSAVVLATALAFCAFCPFFARCNETELNDIKNGKILVKYQAEFDRMVKFVELQEAIDEIDKAMLGYMGKARDKLPRIRDLNSEARHTYQNCVGPVFEWCQSTIGNFDVFIQIFSVLDLKNIIWNNTVSTLEIGLNEAEKSLERLSDVRMRIAELNNAFQHIFYLVLIDFDRGGFYFEEKSNLFMVLTQKIENATKIVKEMDSDLEEDKNNLHMLRGSIVAANNVSVFDQKLIPILFKFVISLYFFILGEN
ncbi:hypothetical protein KR026_011581 [Drosophila bipectinata]|nr:hypothetical protein KR026_011581 [Drosophila bipectinata]